MAEKVLDIYNGQGKVSAAQWGKIKKQGITKVILRCGYTHWRKDFTMSVDESFDHNIKTAHKAGMDIGVYYYSQATTKAEAISEAKFTVFHIKEYRKYITLPVAFDCEFGDSTARFRPAVAKKIGKVGMLDICKAFCSEIQANGFDTMVYANLNMLNNYISSKLPEKFKIWVAQYNSTCDYKKPYYMWQYTSSARLKGILKGDLDMSYFHGEKPAKQPKKKADVVWPELPKRGYFKRGDKGPDVSLVQVICVKDTGLTTKIDGIYGGMTVALVKEYQRKNKLKIDGKFGTQCLAFAKEKA